MDCYVGSVDEGLHGVNTRQWPVPRKLKKLKEYVHVFVEASSTRNWKGGKGFVEVHPGTLLRLGCFRQENNEELASNKAVILETLEDIMKGTAKNPVTK
jgi:hypothetical protein